MNSNYVMEPAKQTPVCEEADVVVIGGGTAGCIAAIAAARNGAKTVLVEKTPVLGGTLTNGGIGWNTFHASSDDNENPLLVVDGIAGELVRRLQDCGGATKFLPTKPGNAHRKPYVLYADHELFKAVICKMLLEANVKVYLQTMFCGISQEDGEIKAVLIENKSGRSAITAKQFIDASGDGDLAKHAGCEQVELWDKYNQVCYPVGMVFGMGGIDFERAYRENKDCVFSEALANGGQVAEDDVLRIAFLFHRSDRYKKIADLGIRMLLSMTSLHPGEATYINGLIGPDVDGSDAVGLSQAEMMVRVKLADIANALKECVPGFENSYVSWSSTQAGIRATKATLCEKNITQDEITSGARFEDEIGLYGFHDWAPRQEGLSSAIGGRGFYGLPYRMLLPLGTKNLFASGRCVTDTVEAHMSTRNVVSCMMQGQAAGTAAALCVKKSYTPRTLPYAELRGELLKQKVILDV